MGLYDSLYPLRRPTSCPCRLAVQRRAPSPLSLPFPTLLLHPAGLANGTELVEVPVDVTTGLTSLDCPTCRGMLKTVTDLAVNKGCTAAIAYIDKEFPPCEIPLVGNLCTKLATYFCE